MKINNLILDFHKRGLITQITDEKKLYKQLFDRSTIYCGFDPTYDSLHVGHLVPLLCLKRFQLAGHRPIALIGGATALIGDPSFKNKERNINTIESIKVGIKNIKNQISLFLDFDCGENSAIIVNNYDWFDSMNLLTFLRDVGKHFSVNQMINKEAVKQRLNRDNNDGISFTEFSYNILQSYDFYYLNKIYGVILQIGGSDQWGNITSGIDLVRRMYNKYVYGLTLPLVTKSDGTKFGKTENDSIWLDPSKTSPYKFYQFWINTSDKDIYHFLKIFTFIDIFTIENMQNKNDINIIQLYPRAQYLLAEKITKIVHGKHGLAAAQRISKILFEKNISSLKEEDFIQLIQDGIPMVMLGKNVSLQEALVKSNLAPSLQQARKMITSNAIMVNGKIKTLEKYHFYDNDRLYNYTLLCRGKKHHCLINWI